MLCDPLVHRKEGFVVVIQGRAAPSVVHCDALEPEFHTLVNLAHAVLG